MENTNNRFDDLKLERSELLRLFKLTKDPSHARELDLVETKIDMSYTTDGRGTQTWNIYMEQTSEDTLDGFATVQLVHEQGICRSSYDMHMSRL